MLLNSFGGRHSNQLQFNAFPTNSGETNLVKKWEAQVDKCDFILKEHANIGIALKSLNM